MFQRTHSLIAKMFYACLFVLFVSGIFTACGSQSGNGKTGPVAAKSLATTGSQNLFSNLGLSDTEIDSRVDEVFNQLFYGDDNQKLYYTSGSDMAYIKAIDSDDVRSEGMSYGMMICVQLDKQSEFNKLWYWAQTYMQHQSGDQQYYFAWQCDTSGNQLDEGPAPDGEMYFVTALLFASQRWGNGSGIYNYGNEAQKIMDAMRTGNDMINQEYMQITFSPNASTFTDPSYHLPAFYECWGRLDTANSDFWFEMAGSARWLLEASTNDSTGLAPDYSTFGGDPYADYGSEHQYFRYDAWRVAMNIAFDWAWWGAESWEQTHADTIQSFFYNQGIDSYTDLWEIDGTALDGGSHSEGLVAMNACASLAATNETRKNAFVQAFWDTSVPTGTYRYYNGMLYMLAMLHCSGKFQAYLGDDDDDTNSTSAFSTIEAESYNSTSSSTIEVVGNDGSGSSIGYIESGDTVTYSNVDFGSSGVASFTARIATEQSPTIEVRLGSSSGTLLGTLSVSSTGGWDTYQELSTTVSSLTGVYDVVLVFSAAVNVDYFTFSSGSAVTGKLVALTFDDGPSETTTSEILDKLEQYGVVASFFLIGQNISSSMQSIIQREATLGCEINNHSYSHSDMTTLSSTDISSEIAQTSNLIYQMAGVTPRFFRPPYISTNNTMYEAIDLPFINGINCTDWDDSVSAATRASTILNNVTEGDIILLHDMEDNSNTVEALDTIIPGLINAGYTLVTVSQLFDSYGVDPDVEYKIWSNVND